MPPPIVQSVYFAAPARELYDLYMNPRRHAEFTDGGAVTISPKSGSRFGAFGGMLRGTTLSVIPGQLIVQRWRSSEWKDDDADSVLVLTFVQADRRGRIDLVHVPEHDHAGVTKGWPQYYWKPLRAYLKRRDRGA